MMIKKINSLRLESCSVQNNNAVRELISLVALQKYGVGEETVLEKCAKNATQGYAVNTYIKV